ncbi:PKD domain containing protein [Fibrella aestuarina BUZ 2]|uniref:PKD domain containing protein n=1 Tax=Fibrella aestuarina BUZ 2 TaxID=1166018 RepID=I0KGH5_9BACT|nr:gliding motility-associated C-terminal domain-containing protein [Fibrella aestuarina]CCH03228.1 PKD domain containing protein [Fibrella aestuarina BUZ 2]
MNRWVTFTIYATLWAIVGLLLLPSSGWAQTGPVSSTPTAASLIRQTEQENQIKIIGKLCTPTNPGGGPVSTTGSSGSATSANANCGSDPVNFYDVDPASFKDRTVWVIDGGAPQTGGVASTSFTTPGVKSITLTRFYSSTVTGGVSTTVSVPKTFTVNVGTPPRQFQNWRNDTTICKGTELKIDPYPSGAPDGVTYLWYPKGEVTQSISTTASGCYSVEVTNAEGCSVQDKIQVSLCPEQNASAGSKWYFGNNAGLDFAGGEPKPIDDGKLSTIEGSASITDTKGNVLFYTDGITIFDKDGKPMQLFDPISGTLTTAASLSGNQRSTQSAIIVPKPVCRGCDYEYYVYTTAEINGTRQVTYSIVDMRRNSGAGAITQQNLPVVSNTTSASSTERSASVRRDRDTTYWVMTHDYGTNCFRVDHLTAQLKTEQKQYCLGTAHDSPARGEGQMKFGPAPQPASTTATSGTGTSGTVVSGTATQGNSNTAVRPVAVVIPGDPNSTDPDRQKSYVEIFNFNTETGELKGPDKRIDMGPAPPTSYGVEFSPDGSKVYVTQIGSVSSVSGVQTQTGPSRIIQYDITDADPASTSAVVAESTQQQFGSLQIGPDGKIYVAVQGASSLGVIDNADGSGGTTTNPFAKPPTFTLTGQDLGGKVSQLGLPNQVANFSQPSSNPGVSASNVCQGNPVELQITPYCPKLKETYNLRVRNSAGAIVAQTLSFTTTSQSYSISTPGTYSATLEVRVITSTGTTCTTATAETSFTVIEQPPAFDLGPDINKCDSNPVSLTIPAVAEQYAWVLGRQIVSTSRVLSTTVSGRYTAYIGNGGECVEQDQITINFYRPGNIDLGPPVPLCEKSTRELTLTSPGFTSFSWTSGVLSTTLTDRTITIDKPGTYSLVASYDRTTPTGPLTCYARDQIDVVSAKLPTITSSLRQPASCTAADGVITITPAPTSVVSGTPTASTSFTYSWTTVSGSPISTTSNSASALTEGTYQVSVTDANACSVVTPFTLQSTSQRLQLALTPSLQQCGEPTSGSVALGVTNGTAVEVRWVGPPGSSFVSTGTSLTGASAGVYSVSATNSLGCVSSASTTIGLSTTSTLSLSNRSNCVGDTVQLIPSRLGNFTSGVIYRWNTGETTERISPRTAGTYSLTATNTQNGCIGTASATAQFVQKPNVSAGNNLSLCLGSPQSLTLLQLTGASPGGGTWAGPSVSSTGSFTANPAQVGQVVTVTYSVTVSGCANSAPRQIALNQVPQVNAGPDADFCEGSGQALRASGSPGALFRWSDGTQGSLIRPNQTGRYTVTASLNGCEASDDLQVLVRPAPRFDLTRQAVICVGDRQQTQLRVVPQSNDQTVVWTTTNTTSTTLTVSAAGTYSVVVTGANGCVAGDAAVVLDRCEPRVFAPNAFSPNGDNSNDRFSPLNAYTTDLELRIYNRWGEVIFASTPETPDWDGTYRGEPAQSMLYPYTITYRSQYFPERPAVVKRGSVLLLR